MSDAKRDASQFCMYYSLVGTLFMLWVGVMISKQPFYMKGLEDVDRCRSNAFGAMWMFVFTFVSSVAYLWYDSNRHRRAAVEYMLNRAVSSSRLADDARRDHEEDTPFFDDGHEGATTEDGDVIDSTQIEPGCW
eukprot:CAMPEP_0197444770 /NCGR_PEP_ID=MMETSP1175-20131217/10166_1 /TAXON_ID=1003142 /ORGANISM="Triceratium dubium, Strain CCMP147" /LENGTH=133 /DNA_ID=CAMNT_0042975617 /DNA_START=355 /DNA_END=753 /DNA_ORIENTATION=+